MALDLTLTPLYRADGEDQPSLPGLMAAVPPRKVARGRDDDRLIVYLQLSGNAVLSNAQCIQAASRAAVAFYSTPGTITAALRAATESVHRPLHALNLNTPTPGRYAVGLLALAVLRGSQLTLLLSGPLQGFLLAAEGARRISGSLSGKGLGLSETPPYFFSQLNLQPNDRLLLCSDVPAAWKAALQDASPASLESTRRRLMALMTGDVNAALMQATQGAGVLTVLRLQSDEKASAAPPSTSPFPPETRSRARTDWMAPVPTLTTTPIATTPPGEVVEAEAEGVPAVSQPSAYGIPSERRDYPEVPEEMTPPASNVLASLPRARSPQQAGAERKARSSARNHAGKPRSSGPSDRTRRAAKTLAGGMQAWRDAVAGITEGLRRFMPRLLPGADQAPWTFSAPAMMFIAVLVPLVVVTVASAVYFRYGRSVQYEQYLVQAQDAEAQALSLTDAAAQREALQRELFYLDKAEAYNQTADTQALRAKAQQNLDQLQGIVRLQFQPVLNTGVGAQVGRLAASDNDLYLLDAQRGAILHVALLSNGFQLDTAFGCAPGSYGGYNVGPLVDLYALPPLNSLNAAVLGVDAAGNLLYCAPGQVAQAVPLPPPDTNWGRIKALTLDSGNLYVLDSQAHAVWVYVGKDGTFVDRPYFFFGGQIPELDDAIDLAVNGDDLYILHSDGHLSTCSYSRIQTVPTRCVDPATPVNPFPAYRDVDLFSEAHFTQMMFTPAPDSALLVLDADSQGVFRFTARALQLDSQLRPQAGLDNPLPPGPVGAMTVSPNHVLYFALKDKIYFAADTP
jgi:hypothetical protein